MLRPEGWNHRRRQSFAAEPPDIPRSSRVAEASAEAHQLSPSEEKILLFRSLFRGREDVYPSRWQNTKTGRSGY